MSASSLKAVFYALGANAGIAIAKSFAAFFTGSGSLLAESLHSWSDCINQIMLLVGMKQAKKAPDKNHPMGYAKVSYFWAMLVAVLLFFMSGVFSIHEGFERITHSEKPVEHLGLSLIVLAISIVMESFSLYGALKESKSERGSQSIWKWIKTTRHSEILVVVCEDVGALLGLVVAFTFLMLTLLTGNPIYDAIGTAAIGVLMCGIAYVVMSEVKAMITGESISAEKEEEIKKFLEEQPEVEKVINLITIQWGQDIMIATKAQMSKVETPEELIKNISVVEEKMQEKFGVKWSFFEPDIK